jgi:ubiquinone/menaquinone biosynthesis C-methylase UbiE
MRNINLDDEKNFENRKASGEKIRAAQSKFYWATSLLIEKHKEQTFKAIKGKNILEIGCSTGYDAIDYCKYAKEYIGVDISNLAIENSNALMLKNASFYCVDGHKLPTKDKTIDYVIVNSLLHHLDLDTSFKEITRVLKVNGALIFREPLGTNPAFLLYRKLTPYARTVDERPFTFEDLKIMRKYFILSEEVQWFGFLNLLSAYAKSVKLRMILTSVDRLISFTPLKYFYWQFSGVAKLRAKN